MKRCKNCNKPEDLEEEDSLLDDKQICGHCKEPQYIECPKCFNQTLFYAGAVYRKKLKKRNSIWWFVCFHEDCDYETDIIFPLVGMDLGADEYCDMHDHHKWTYLPECRECLVKEYSNCEESIQEVKNREELIAKEGITSND